MTDLIFAAIIMGGLMGALFIIFYIIAGIFHPEDK